MLKPQMKKEVAVRYIFKEHLSISFNATADAVEDLRSFGEVDCLNIETDLYVLRVDSRYDFDEVVGYIRHYGEK